MSSADKCRIKLRIETCKKQHLITQSLLILNLLGIKVLEKGPKRCVLHVHHRHYGSARLFPPPTQHGPKVLRAGHKDCPVRGDYRPIFELEYDVSRPKIFPEGGNVLGKGPFFQSGCFGLGETRIKILVCLVLNLWGSFTFSGG